MEKVLILAYYYPPCRGVAAYRPQSWAKDFRLHGYAPTVITRHWSGDESVWEDYMKDADKKTEIITDQHSSTIYLPYKKNKLLQFAEKKWVRSLKLNKLIYLGLTLNGDFQMEIDGYNCFKEYLFEHLRTEKYKLIIITSPPLNVAKLAYKAAKKFKIPFAIDFQDSWNNLMLAENYNPGRKEKFYNSVKEFYLRKWLGKALFSVTVTPAIGDRIKEHTHKPVEIITNGFEQNAYSSRPVIPSSDVFNISVMGTIHPMQDITAMLEGLNLFLQEKDPAKVKLNFIGLDSFPEMSGHVKSALPASFLHVSPRVKMEEAVDLTLAANVLLFPSYKGYKGYYTAKIFEYLGAQRNILMMPGNNDIVDELIGRTQAGKIANSATEFAQILNSWHNEWKNTGTLIYNGIPEEIRFFSRERQNELLCEAITRHLSA
ncbi:MAG: hypothetical protein JWP12_1127 [Bacteroidetes bacterium]|nr:hypothetical protein [Bacteroidota bacterium]